MITADHIQVNPIIEAAIQADGKKRQLGNYFKNKSTRRLIEQIEQDGIKAKISNRGYSDQSGTWLHKRMIDHFKLWLNGVGITKHERSESRFMDILVPILETCKNIEVKTQSPILKYGVDLQIEWKLPNADEDGNEYEEYHGAIIEYDEAHHATTKKQDKKRQKKIMDECKKYYAGFTFIRVPEKNGIEALKYLIPFLCGIETSHSYDMLNKICKIEAW